MCIRNINTKNAFDNSKVLLKYLFHLNMYFTLLHSNQSSLEITTLSKYTSTVYLTLMRIAFK